MIARLVVAVRPLLGDRLHHPDLGRGARPTSYVTVWRARWSVVGARSEAYQSNLRSKGRLRVTTSREECQVSNTKPGEVTSRPETYRSGLGGKTRKEARGGSSVGSRSSCRQRCAPD